MNMDETSSPFFDAAQGASPDAPSSVGAPDNADGTPASENSSPFRQRRLFANNDRKNDNHDNNVYLERLHNQSIDLDLVLVKLESQELGEGDPHRPSERTR